MQRSVSSAPAPLARPVPDYRNGSVVYDHFAAGAARVFGPNYSPWFRRPRFGVAVAPAPTDAPASVASRTLLDDWDGNASVRRLLAPNLRTCYQITLDYGARARIRQIARHEAAFLAYRVATPRHSFNLRNPFSTG